MARRLRKQLQVYHRDAKACGSDDARMLREQAEKAAAEDRERRRRFEENKKNEAKAADDRKVAIAEAQARSSAMQAKCLQLRLQEGRVKFEHMVQQTHQRWLQLEYPVVVAKQCLAYKAAASKDQLKGWAAHMQELLKNQHFTRHVHVPRLWKPEVRWTSEWGETLRYDGKRREKVRCGLEFRGLLDSLFAPTRFGIPGPRDACAVLMGLWERILPKARDVFTGAYSAPRLFAHSEYTMEGAFLYGVIVLSKLLGHEKWPVGLYSPWPPPLPEELQPEVPSSLVLDA